MKNFIEFKNIDFAYEGKKVFDRLTLQIEKGQKVGLVGTSGAGKTTLINLLLKNYAITNYEYWEREATKGASSLKGGDILINGQSIYDVTSDSLRRNISLIPQDIMLFHTSLKENIGYAKEGASPEEIIEASKKAHIHSFIESLPENYETIVGERGIKLSGGQRQRVAIARAILKNAPILILDEATSSLDSETESEIGKALNESILSSNVTMIAIAHRLSTIKHMDRIIVLEQGKIAEDGSFESLLNLKGKFAELWSHQVNGMIV